MRVTHATKARGLPKPSRCVVTGKVRWPDGKAAVAVLHRASTAAHWAELSGAESRRRETRHYPCPHCKGFHTTSQTSWGAA